MTGVVETWVISEKGQGELDVTKIKFLRSIIGTAWMDKVWNEHVRRRAGVRQILSNRMD